MGFLLAALDVPPSSLELFAQYCIEGLTFGALIALIALGYTMVYGIIGLINFAHGDLFMLGSFLALAVASAMATAMGDSTASVFITLFAATICSAAFCASLNVAVDQIVYRPLRNAPKLAPLVSAIGVSFVFMNVGQIYGGVADVNFGASRFISEANLLEQFGVQNVRFTAKNLLVFGVTIPILLGLTFLVKRTKLGKSMRATEQNAIAAQLMGINVNFVIAATFAIGGALAGVASVVYGISINTIGYQMGFQNGLYAFTAAVLGGIGKLPGAVLGGLIIGLVRSLGSAYVGEMWTSALIFAILIVLLVFRPSGLLGSTAGDKV